MTTKNNSFEGIANGVVVTTANSGGASGDAFDVVTGSVTASTTGAMVGSRGAVAALSGTAEAMVGWTTSGTTHYLRRYVRIPASAPHNMWLVRGSLAGVAQWGIRYNTSLNIDFMRDDPGVGGISYVQALFLAATTYAVGTVYRIEATVTTTGISTFSVFLGESTTPLETKNFTGAMGAIDSIRFGNGNSANTTSSLDLDGVGWSDTAALGPYPSTPVASYTREDIVEIDARASAGTVTLTRQSGDAVTISESPTGLFRVELPLLRGDDVVLHLVATNGGSTDTEVVTISAGSSTGAAPLVRVSGAYV